MGQQASFWKPALPIKRMEETGMPRSLQDGMVRGEAPCGAQEWSSFLGQSHRKQSLISGRGEKGAAMKQ